MNTLENEIEEVNEIGSKIESVVAIFKVSVWCFMLGLFIATFL